MRNPTHQFDRMALSKCLNALSGILFPLPNKATLANIDRRLATGTCLAPQQQYRVR